MTVPLRSFIAQSLTEIIAGVRDAKTQLADREGLDAGIINPPLSSFPGKSSETAGLVRTFDHPGKDRDNPGRYAQFVRFSVAVHVTESKAREASGEGGFQIGVFSLKAGAGGEASHEQQIVNRIEFSVPIRLGE